jgi:hypothetical protein
VTSKLRANAPDGEDFVIVIREPDGSFAYAVNAGVLYKRVPDPAIWGIMIADLVQHVTNALEGKLGTAKGPMPREEIFQRITDVLLKELQSNEKHAARVTNA